MKILLTVITVLVLCTNRLVVADDQCTHYQFKSPFYPGSSCEDIYNKNPESQDRSGYYWILKLDGPRYVYCGMSYTGLSCEDIYNNNLETGNNNGYYPINNTVWTFCNMTLIAAIADGHIILSCAGVEGQWRRIAGINISAGDDCPTGWLKSSNNDISFCRAPNDNPGCYSTFFSTNGVSYQHVCGRARGYQKGIPDAFYGNRDSINTCYVDGLSITYGNPRHHIWTYVAGAVGGLTYTFVTVHVLLLQDQPLPLLLKIITTVNLEQKLALVVVHITSLTHCGMVQVVLLAIHVVPTLTNHGSIIS